MVRLNEIKDGYKHTPSKYAGLQVLFNDSEEVGGKPLPNCAVLSLPGRSPALQLQHSNPCISPHSRLLNRGHV